MPGNDYVAGSGRSETYNLFYKIFGGIRDGVRDSPHNLNNVDHIDDYNLTGYDGSEDNVPNSGGDNSPKLEAASADIEDDFEDATEDEKLKPKPSMKPKPKLDNDDPQ